ncbi:NAD(P)-dependent oxidoreductase [Mesoterricola silvestris]|uniref:D-glycerate dehydrogenase n=1 Tax=Mesoterricola silvestris TaxID=2927979 RepID=A0AA48GK39_9BACT|nr:NAD(P)-dependent oxidoreductase [Mesoterricola silvestris]BDU72654.1 D-glycerate dehydrogenase [Mesoterricola silvestris]
MTVRILSTSALVGPSLQRLGARFPELSIAPFRSIAWKMSLANAEALVGLPSEALSEADLDYAPKLKVIGTCSAGVGHLPVEACARRGIAIVDTAAVLTDATADLALTLLLALTRRLKEGEALVRSGTWKGWAMDQVLGTGVAGKVCAILGTGGVGKAFARRVWALGMKPVFWDRENRGTPVDFGAGIARRLPLADLLPRAAVLSVHCPLTAETRGLLTRPILQLLPPGAFLINTARGGILDEDAAIQMLHQGLLGGAGLDVYEDEPNINPAWLKAPRTVLLPHLGSATQDTREAMSRVLCDGIAATLGGKLG